MFRSRLPRTVRRRLTGDALSRLALSRLGLSRRAPSRSLLTALALAATVASASVVATITAGPARADTRAATDDSGLRGQITVERRIRVPLGGATTRIPVNVQLTNTSADDLVITAPNICQVHNYHVVLPNNDLVAAKGEIDCEGGETSVTIPAGDTLYASNSLLMRPGILETGRRYFVIYEFWGVRMKAPFVLIEHE